jgi:hypothetical protein
MGNKPPFYQEVLDALAGGNDPDLTMLRDLCVAVESERRSTASPLVNKLVKRRPRDPPLSTLSAELFHELMMRVLLAGWPFELTHLLDWFVPARVAAGADAALIANWAGVISRMQEPSPTQDLQVILKKLMQYMDAFEVALAHLSATAVSFPPPPPAPTPLNRPPPPPPKLQVTLESQLIAVVEHVSRLFQMLTQQMLAISIMQLENDRSSHVLRILQGLHDLVGVTLDAQKNLPDDKAKRAIDLPIRIMEIQSRRIPAEQHRFLDAFTPHGARTIEFSSFNRLDNNPPEDWRGPIGDMHRLRGRQLEFYFDAYGEPERLDRTLSEEDKFRQTLIQKLIKDKYSDQMKLERDDDLVAFLTSFFEAIVRVRVAAPFKEALVVAQEVAWRAVVKFLDRYLERLTSHTKFNIAEGPKSYLELDFPRSITGGLIHDCGVYATRLAYILMSLGERVDRIFKGCFEMKVSWILLPLHVGLLVRNNQLNLITHNQALFLLNKKPLENMRRDWERTHAPDDPPPGEALDLRFLEDVAASAFNPDVDMPLVRMDLPGRGMRVTKKLVWNSYRRLMREDRIFNRAAVENPRSPDFQFDLYFLSATNLQRRWFNRDIVPFWNVRARQIWEKAQDKLAAANFLAARDDYVAALEKEVKLVGTTYDDVSLDKSRLSEALGQRAGLLQKGVRIVASERLPNAYQQLGPLGSVLEHVEEIKTLDHLERDPQTMEPVKPPFARDEEALSPIPN